MANTNVDSYCQVHIFVSSSGRLRHSYTPALACHTFRLKSGSESIVNFQFMILLTLAIKKGGETTTGKLLSISPPFYMSRRCLSDIQFFTFIYIMMTHKSQIKRGRLNPRLQMQIAGYEVATLGCCGIVDRSMP